MNDVPFGTRLWYGVGEIAQGTKNCAFQLLLLYYYNQVLGLSASRVGVVLFVALLFDAITDPLVGAVSDTTNSRWGRRHGYMYAAAVPLGVAFYLVFSPPTGLSAGALQLWLLVWVVGARGAMTLYYVPHMALGAELSSDYYERTRLTAIRIFFGFLGAVLLIAAIRGLFLPATTDYPVGQSNPEGYGPMGAWLGALMAGAIFASALGTHKRIPLLAKPTTSGGFAFRALWADLGEALSNPSFRAFFLGMLLYTLGRSVDLALWMYVGTFFFELGTNAQLVPLVGLIGVLLGTLIWPRFKIEKRAMFVWGMLGYMLGTSALPVLKLVGLFPPQGHPLYVPLIVGVMFCAALSAAGPSIATSSMVADVVDEQELEQGRRLEGVCFGALAFAIKAATGLGSWLGSVALTLIAFPTQVQDPGAVDAHKVTLLAVIYGPLVFVVIGCGLWFVGGYRINADRHAEILRQLAERKSGYPAV